ncbi:MAG: acyl-[acyl-carrier-protein] thioesterase [Lachnospiraceae bacterium]|nr:acyl-[acyl-carrier-protein] thioesterase [Lachnospiraceae bacterium]
MYEMKRQITYSQVASDLKMDMAGIAHFFQDCTLFHSEAIGKGLEEVKRSCTAWFLSGWQIEAERYPGFKEQITVRTWPYDFKGMYGYRNFDILDADGRRIVKANSIWIFMDLEKMHPARPSDEDLAGYDMEPKLEMEYAPRKIKIMEEAYRFKDIEQTPIVVKNSFLDSNYHVNNGRYVAEAMDFIQEGKNVKKMRADYRRAAALGDKMYPSVYVKDDICQVVFLDEEGIPFVIIETSE